MTDTGVLEFPEEAMEDEALEAAVQTMILGTDEPTDETPQHAVVSHKFEDQNPHDRRIFIGKMVVKPLGKSYPGCLGPARCSSPLKGDWDPINTHYI